MFVTKKLLLLIMWVFFMGGPFFPNNPAPEILEAAKNVAHAANTVTLWVQIVGIAAVVALATWAWNNLTRKS